MLLTYLKPLRGLQALCGLLLSIFCVSPAWAESHDRLEQVETVNWQINQVAYQTDQDLWGQKDYWASPAEFFERGAGDCEDFALAKYERLLALGVAPEKLNLAFVRRTQGFEAHMVLIYEHLGQQWVLDNFEAKMQLLQARKDLIPVYRFNMASTDIEYLKADWQVLRRVPKALQLIPAWQRYHSATI